MRCQARYHTSFYSVLRHRALLHVGSLLEPDDVTFSVLIRGYGEAEPPQWLAISGLLSMMSRKYEVQPSTGSLLVSLKCILQQPHALTAPICLSPARCCHIGNCLLHLQQLACARI